MLLLTKHWDKYAINLETRCCIWTAATAGSKGKRPYVWHAGKYKCVTRIVCEEHNGPPPFPGAEAAHAQHCSSNLCVRGDHTYWATKVQNEADKPPGMQKRISMLGVAASTRDERGRFS